MLTEHLPPINIEKVSESVEFATERSFKMLLSHEYSVRPLVDADFRSLVAKLGPDIANIVDAAIHNPEQISKGELAAEEIAGLLLSNGGSLVAEVLRMGFKLDADAISRLGPFQKMIALGQIAVATFPGMGPTEIAQAAVNKLMAAGLTFSAAATGSRRH